MDAPLPNIRPIFTSEEIADRVQTLGTQIERTLPPGPATLVCVLRGSFMFAADLARAIRRPIHIDFLGVSSYGDATESSGEVHITADLGSPVRDRHVVIVEDIVDTGLTLVHLKRLLAARSPASLRVCTLLSKPSRRQVKIDVDFVGFEIPDVFVVGYGLDAAQLHRNLPFIGEVIEP